MKVKIYILSIMMVLVFHVIAYSTWDNEYAVHTTGEGENEFWVACDHDSSGNLYMVWTDNYNATGQYGAEIYCNKHDTQSGWQRPVLITNSSAYETGKGGYPDIAVVGNDIHIVYVSAESGTPTPTLCNVGECSHLIYASGLETDDFTSGTPTPVMSYDYISGDDSDDMVGHIFHPTLAKDSTGDLHVAWNMHQYTYGHNHWGGHRMYYNTTDAQGDWEDFDPASNDKQRISPHKDDSGGYTGYNAWFARLAFDDDDNPFCVYNAQVKMSSVNVSDFLVGTPPPNCDPEVEVIVEVRFKADGLFPVTDADEINFDVTWNGWGDKGSLYFYMNDGDWKIYRWNKIDFNPEDVKHIEVRCFINVIGDPDTTWSEVQWDGASLSVKWYENEPYSYFLPNTCLRLGPFVEADISDFEEYDDGEDYAKIPIREGCDNESPNKNFISYRELTGNPLSWQEVWESYDDYGEKDAVYHMRPLICIDQNTGQDYGHVVWINNSTGTDRGLYHKKQTSETQWSSPSLLSGTGEVSRLIASGLAGPIPAMIMDQTNNEIHLTWIEDILLPLQKKIRTYYAKWSTSGWSTHELVDEGIDGGKNHNDIDFVSNTPIIFYNAMEIISPPYGNPYPEWDIWKAEQE